MKVLHLWSTAGVGGLLAKYMSQSYGTIESDCIMRRKYDPFNLTAKGTVYDCNWFQWFLICLTKPRGYNVIHVHSYDKILPFLKILYPGKKLIIHYHGTLIRDNWQSRRHLWRLADKIIVSTPDLLEGAPRGTVYLPNPVDYDMIDEVNISQDLKIRKAFHVENRATDKAREYAKSRGLELVIFTKGKKGIDHKDMLRKICSYFFYIDVKRDFAGTKILRAHSLTGFEAMYAGAIVINWDNDTCEGLPGRHEKMQVCQLLYEIYRGLHLD